MYILDGSATMRGVPIVDNTADGGGGIYNHDGALTLVNATVSGNTASDGCGGGLFNEFGTAVLTYTTVASNTATGEGGGIHRLTGAVLVQDTILADNSPANCGALLASNGHNLDSGTTCGLDATGDVTATNPLLGLLAEDGGTLVHPLAYDSPAVDRGMCLVGPTVDQRGVTRPQGSGCDVGAYEFVTVAPTGVHIDGPTSGVVDESYTFTATVSPPEATPPITYTWSPLPDSGQGTGVVTYSWNAAGEWTITVTAENGASTAPVLGTYDVVIGGYEIYVPLVVKP